MVFGRHHAAFVGVSQATAFLQHGVSVNCSSGYSRCIGTRDIGGSEYSKIIAENMPMKDLEVDDRRNEIACRAIEITERLPGSYLQ